MLNDAEKALFQAKKSLTLLHEGIYQRGIIGCSPEIDDIPF